MKKRTLGLVLGLCLLPFGAMFAADAPRTDAGRVTVIFDNPEQFTDVKDAFIPTDKGRDAILAEIRDFIVLRASSCLQDGQKLEVRFTDIDLAGDFEPQLGSSFNSVRIMKDTYTPKMALEFKLTGADGNVLSGGSRRLTDQNYLQRVVPHNNDPLCYDKALLADWLEKDIAPAAAAAH